MPLTLGKFTIVTRLQHKLEDKQIASETRPLQVKIYVIKGWENHKNAEISTTDS